MKYESLMVPNVVDRRNSFALVMNELGQEPIVVPFDVECRRRIFDAIQNDWLD